MRYLFALALVFVTCDVALATTGEELQHNCRIATSVRSGQSLGKTEAASAGQCYGQVEGVLDTLTIWHAMNGVGERQANGEACVPRAVTVRQAALIVLKYIDANPEKLHLLGSNLIIFALKEAYPCKD